jgi:hypothetical protein
MTPVKVVLSTLAGQERELGPFPQGVVWEPHSGMPVYAVLHDVATGNRIARTVLGGGFASLDDGFIFDRCFIHGVERQPSFPIDGNLRGVMALLQPAVTPGKDVFRTWLKPNTAARILDRHPVEVTIEMEQLKRDGWLRYSNGAYALTDRAMAAMGA